MSLRAIPLTILAFILYHVFAFLGGSGPADAGCGSPAAPYLCKQIVQVPMLRGAKWKFTIGDLVILATMILLFIELLKSSYTSTASMIDHGLSMVVFILCLVWFLVFDWAATSVFFFIMVAALIDVVAGALIGIRVARRDLNIGGDA